MFPSDKLLEISMKSYADERSVIKEMISNLNIDPQLKEISVISNELAMLIKKSKPSMMESFMRKYKMSSNEGRSLMCLSEALLRVPDEKTAIELIEDKLRSGNWKEMLSSDGSFAMNASALGLAIANGLLKSPYNQVTDLSKPLILKAMRQAMEVISKQFIMGDNIKNAVKKSRNYIKKGYRISFDILGESARDASQAKYYFDQYLSAIKEVGEAYDKNLSLNERPNISIKLSALHPRLELSKQQRVMKELMPRLSQLMNLAIEHKVTISFDAEEASRLDIYMEILTHLLKSEDYKGFDGIGFVVQAYQHRAPFVINYIADLAREIGSRISVRLVKGAYWDSEIKNSQELGLEGYPVYTKKVHTDVSYIFCAKKLFEYSDLIYPQFATHNAVTMAYIRTLGKGIEFEFQKLHGMGDSLHNESVKTIPTRIYAPVGRYEDLLAYLMRRMLENGANSSFVYQASDPNLPISKLTEDPISIAKQDYLELIPTPAEIFKNRFNSLGYDLGIKFNFEKIKREIGKYSNKSYSISSIISGETIGSTDAKPVYSPCDLSKKIGEVSKMQGSEMVKALDAAHDGFIQWSKTDFLKRAELLEAIAEKFHENRYELYSILINEGGKNIKDSIAEVREAIDFARYYASQARDLFKPTKMQGYTGETNELRLCPRGVFLCISPWNFPLAIFSGQIFAALVSGNTVISKPAESTSIIAHYAINLMLECGVPKSVLHLVLGSGREISKYIIEDNRISGVCFTGSNETARSINMALASRNCGIAAFIAETGGQNAMIVDSSALLEQVCDSVIQSAFGSIGQRCSALRVLYVQEEVYDKLITLISGAMQELSIGNTNDFANDLGPVITESVKKELQKHVDFMASKGCEVIDVHKSARDKKNGSFFPPHIIKIKDIHDIGGEVFGPVLHVKTFKYEELGSIIDEINSTGFGLTFGVHSRIESKIDKIQQAINAGNIYVNRSTIGAQVETQPFGGEGLSGTGFKAGGPHYLLRFCTERVVCNNTAAVGGNIDLMSVLA
jgi:RHH-type proline utilization regulon transcriptional repressor/proline dehydrogenase/delta 1-pyrroline-5-carboxylate dehydrogenase